MAANAAERKHGGQPYLQGRLVKAFLCFRHVIATLLEDCNEELLSELAQLSGDLAEVSGWFSVQEMQGLGAVHQGATEHQGGVGVVLRSDEHMCLSRSLGRGRGGESRTLSPE